MSWRVVDAPVVTGHRLPSPVLRIQSWFQWNDGRDIEITSARLTASLPSVSGASWVDLPLAPQGVSVCAHGQTSVNTSLPMSRMCIRAIEDWRQGGSEPVSIDCWASFSFRTVETFELPVASGSQERNKRPLHALGASGADQAHFTITIQRDQWLKILKDLGWDEYVVFEMAVRPFKRLQNFEAAYKSLDQAQTALRQGQWPMAVVESRKALEAIAAIEAPGVDPKAQFKSLVEKVLPGAHDEAKRNVTVHGDHRD